MKENNSINLKQDLTSKFLDTTAPLYSKISKPAKSAKSAKSGKNVKGMNAKAAKSSKADKSAKAEKAQGAKSAKAAKAAKSAKTAKSGKGNAQKAAAKAEKSTAKQSAKNSAAGKNSGKIFRTPLKIIPLGGLDEIGKNCTVFEFENDIIIVDCGMSFPDSDMPGVDIVIPDVSYLVKNKDKIRGLFITHGH